MTEQRPSDEQLPQEQPGENLATRPPRRARLPVVIAAVTLVLSLAGWGWFASQQAREAWWAFGQNVAVGPDDQGWAGLDTVSVRLAGADTVPVVDEETPPAGFEFLAVDFTVDAATPTELSTCEVQVRDEQGRLFLAGAEVPRDDAYDSSLTCGTSDPDEDPVPTRQSVLVLVPVDAELVSVRVDARAFPPAEFIELPLPS